MSDSQRESRKRYEQTEKGKAARRRAEKRYKSERETWLVYFDAEVADQLKARNPDGLSKSALLNEIVKKFLDTP